MLNLNYRQDQVSRATILKEPKQEKIALILETLAKVNKLLEPLEQVTQEDLNNNQVTDYQKKRLFKLYTIVEQKLLKTVSLKTENILDNKD